MYFAFCLQCNLCLLYIYVFKIKQSIPRKINLDTQRPTVKFFSVAFLDLLALNNIFQILQSYIVYAQVFKNKQTHWSMNSVLTPNASAMYPKVRDR